MNNNAVGAVIRRSAEGELRMSFVSRTLLAGLVCAALGAEAVAAPVGDDPGSTGGRLVHASKCVLTLGFSGGCEKDQADSKVKREEDHRPAEVKAADEHSTRHQFVQASKCVMSFGFVGACDKNAPEGSSAASDRRADAAPDNSTGHQFAHASKCVLSFGFAGGCDKNAPESSPAAPERHAEAPPPAAPAAPDNSTGGQFKRASTCVFSFGFVGDCNKK